MQVINDFFNWLNGIVWGVPMIILILGTGLYLQIRLGFMPILRIVLYIIHRKNQTRENKGDMHGQ